MQFISQLLEHPTLFAYFVGANNYTWLHFRNGDRRLLAKPLTYFEERLPAFVRVHKTALVNPACVVTIQPPPRAKMSGTVRMQDGANLPVSRRRWQEVVGLLEAKPEEPKETTAPLNGFHKPEASPRQTPYVAPKLVLLAVMTGEALLLTRECIENLKLPCQLQQVESGAELVPSLLLHPHPRQPALILLDARTNRVDRVLTLRSLKSHPQLRSIPVVWLAAPGDDTMQAYALDANSVVVVPNDSIAFMHILEQLCRYWLQTVQLPPELV